MFALTGQPVKNGTAKVGEREHRWLLVRDLNLNADTFDQHLEWRRNTAQMQASAEPIPRRSIFFLPVISPYHPVAAVWTTFMMAVDVLYTAFWVPLGVAFCTESFGDISTGCAKADLMGGCIYFVNTIMGFQAGLVLRHNYKRVKVLDGPRVALYYIGLGQGVGAFWLDMLAVVPFIYLIIILSTPGLTGTTGPTSWVNVLSLIRLVRLLRLVSLSRVVVSNTLSGRYQEALPKYISVTTMYTILLIYCLAVIINLQACVMILIAYMEGLDNSWMTSVSWEDFTTLGPNYQWYAAVYWVITTATTTGYGDFVPHSTVEQVFANIYMICGMLLFGLLVGTIANALTRASAQAAQLYRFRNKMSAISRWLLSHSVPDKVQKQVKDYFSDVWVLRDQTSLDAEIFNDLPTSLRAQVAQYVTMDVISEVHLFRNQEDGLRSLVAAVLRPVDVIQGHDICRQGEEGDRMWLGSEGELQALQHQLEPVYLGTPCLIGESVLLGDDMPSFRLRPYTIRAATGLVKLWECRLSDLWPIVRMYPRLKEDLLEHIRSRLLQELGFHQDRAVVEKSWCESVASISAALLKQSTSVVATAAQELQSATAEDGSLVNLLQGLMEFSTTRAKRITLLPPQLDQQGSGQGPLPGQPNGPTGGGGGSGAQDAGAAASQGSGQLQLVSVSSGPQPQLVAAASAGLSNRPSWRRGPAGGSGDGVSLVLGPNGVMSQPGAGARGAQGCCSACGRVVCGACRQVVRPGAGVPGMEGGATPSITSLMTGSSRIGIGPSEAASNTSSVLLASLGVSNVRQPWPSVSRTSRRIAGGVSRYAGMSTMSTWRGGNQLSTTSIPTENFGEGYGLWG